MRSPLPALLLALAGVAACASPAEPTRAAADFPRSWYGSWEGTAQGWGPAGPRETFRMRYEFGPTDVPGRHQWRIVYGEGERLDVRDYQLVEQDPGAGSFAVDEGGGMLLEARYLGGVLYTRFDIGGTRLLVRDELVDGAIQVEFVTGPAAPARTTATDPPAGSFPVRHVQRARLARVSAGAGSAD